MRLARLAGRFPMPTASFAKSLAAAACLGLVLPLGASNLFAASINYGSYGPVPPGVTFLDVTESSGTDPVPLFGPPSPFATGLGFQPTNFVAHSAGGGGDFIEGQVNFTVMNAAGIADISLAESGDYELSGLGAAGALVRATATIDATVTQINGVNVAPINLTPVNVTFVDQLPPSEVGPWSLGLLLNVAGQLAPNSRATKIDVIISNRLTAVSDPGAGAFIAKKHFRVGVGIIPEPASLALAGIALGALLPARRRRV